MDDASDSDSGDIQHIKPAAVKPTLDLKNVPIWDDTISTRDNAQAIKISLGSAGYLDTTKGKGTHHNSLPIMLTCPTAALGGAATGAREGEGEDCHAMTPMEINDITITELENLRPVTLTVSVPPCQPWSRAGSRLGWQDHRSHAFASVIGFIRFYLTTQPAPVRYIVENVPSAPDFPEILSSLGTGNIMRASACGSAGQSDTLMWTNIPPQTDIQNYVNNINAIELTDPGPCTCDLCLSEFSLFTPVVATDYFPKFVARPGSYAFRMQTNAKQGYSFYFSRLLNSMNTPDGAVIHLQPYPGTTGLYGIKLLSIRDPSHGAGLAERSFRTIGECAQAMLLHAGLDHTFWDWAYLHAVYLCNRQWSSSVTAISYTLMTGGRNPDLTDLHVFGCVAWVSILVTMRAAKGKMKPKSWPGIYVGHHEDSAG
eukprot:jgi/Tetstr1/448190/TSEL_035481.t1